MQVPVKGPDGKEIHILVGIRRSPSTASSPACRRRACAAYERRYGEKAADLLARVRKESDRQLLAEVRSATSTRKPARKQRGS